MQLGSFTRNKAGNLVGDIRTLNSIVEDVEIVPVEGRSQNAPNYRVYSATGSDFGAGWNKVSGAGKSYVSLVLRDPSFNNGQPLYPILIEGAEGEFVMAWEAPDANRAPSRPTVTPAEVAAAEETAPAPGKRKK